jgi:hypothetical protein
MSERERSVAGDESTASSGARKPYEKPVLQIYGELTEITQATRLTGQNDGGAHPNKHFTV